MAFVLSPKANPEGTSLRGEFSAAFSLLQARFGDPIPEADGYKVSTEWIFTEEKTGEVVTLYDYKETALYDEGLPTVEEFRALPSYDWHVGARSPEVAARFVTWLKTDQNGMRQNSPAKFTGQA